jgi:hypothetical protein
MEMVDPVVVLRESLDDLRGRLQGASDRDASSLTLQIRGLVAELATAERSVLALVPDELEGRRGLTRKPMSAGSKKRAAGGK